MKWFYSRKAQSTGEYALVFAIILGAIVAMQTYVKRGMQARVKSGTDYMAQQTTAIGATDQYEPYYLDTDYTAERDGYTSTGIKPGQAGVQDIDQTKRRVGGETQYLAPANQAGGEGGGEGGGGGE